MERRFAAILVADMAGDSRLMEHDELSLLKRQKTRRRELIDPRSRTAAAHFLRTTGDGMLVEFASAQDAARCAIDVQSAMLSAIVSMGGRAALRRDLELRRQPDARFG